MKSIVLAFALIAVVAADVSHLNNKYLPPVQSAPGGVVAGVSEYVQQADEIPQVIGANTHTPAHLIDLPVVPADEPQVDEIAQPAPQAPTDVYGGAPGAVAVADEPTPVQYDAFSAQGVQDVSNGIDTQYGSNGGYIY